MHLQAMLEIYVYPCAIIIVTSFKCAPGIFNPILFGKWLFQQFAVITYIKIENSRLDYIRNNQDNLRADLYQGLVDSLQAGEAQADSIGKRTVLATSFIGGPRGYEASIDGCNGFGAEIWKT
jgi:hypothetical protein